MENGIKEPDTPQILLQSRDHGELLNVIDLLRSQGINRYVQLPQLIVCGDQSSGKSSVLEAVSGIRFPTKENLCTRFATELILRRSPEEKTIVEIIPGGKRSEEERKKLAAFKSDIKDVADIPMIIEVAKKIMGLDMDGKSISDDILRIELSGPHQSHLTLVDLPGVVHSETRQHSTSDVAMISSLVKSYMANRRSIILAVVSAKNDLANQIITKLARNHDPKGLRTLGIITKPDGLNPGSENERGFVALANNEDVIFRLGWHVLRNRDYKERHCTAEERDGKEKKFFSQGIWSSLPPSILGIGALKPRLSAVLRDQIIAELPNLIQDVRKGIEDCEKNLARLGESRSTVSDQRLHLIRISQEFTALVQAAIDGVYSHDFFGDAGTEKGYTHRLRAVVANVLADFAADMRNKGAKRIIVDDDSFTMLPRIRRADFINQVRELMKRSKGRELPGTFNPLIIGDLFYQQASPWEQIVKEYANKIIEATRRFLEMLLVHCSDDTTRQALLVDIIEPAIETCTGRLNMKMEEILQPHQRGHPITYNHYFTETIQKMREERNRKEILDATAKFHQNSKSNDFFNNFDRRELVAALTKRTELDMDRYAASEAIFYMEAYYKVGALTPQPTRPDLSRPSDKMSHDLGRDEGLHR